MNTTYFIANKLSFKGKLASVAIALSFFVMIISVAIASGFREEIRDGLGSMVGDIQILPSNLSITDGTNPIESNPKYLPYIVETEGVKSIVPVVYRAGVVKHQENIHGVLFKAIPRQDTVRLGVSIPRKLANLLHLEVGDDLLSYFIGEKVRLRNFKVSSIYDGVLEFDDKLIVYANIEDIQRINGWDESQISVMEIGLDDSHKSEASIAELTQNLGYITNSFIGEDETPVFVKSLISQYPQIFDWLGLIDFNVLFILILMTVVAGFNMISGLLILLFENISTIGLLKSLGLSNHGIIKVFLTTSSVLVLKGMLIGNFLAFVFCFIQSKTQLIELNPENYFVSYVPISIDILQVIQADVFAYLIIMLLLLIPSHFISSVDPSQTMRVK